MRINCPHCGEAFELNVGKLIREIPSEARAEASRENGKKGGRPAILDGNTFTDAQADTLRKELGIDGTGHFSLSDEQYDSLTNYGDPEPTSRLIPEPDSDSQEWEATAVLKTTVGRVRINVRWIFNAEETNVDESEILPWDYAHTGESSVAYW